LELEIIAETIWILACKNNLELGMQKQFGAWHEKTIWSLKLLQKQFGSWHAKTIWSLACRNDLELGMQKQFGAWNVKNNLELGMQKQIFWYAEKRKGPMIVLVCKRKS
jgi:hypothetical protein